MENKKEKKSSSSCFFLCTSGKKKKKETFEVKPEEPKPEPVGNKSMEKLKSCSTLRSEIKEEGKANSHDTEKRIVEGELKNNLDISKQFKSSSHLDFSIQEVKGTTERKEKIENDKKGEFSLNLKAELNPPVMKEKQNNSHFANYKMNNSREDITFRNRTGLNDSNTLKQNINSSIFHNPSKKSPLGIDTNELNKFNSGSKNFSKNDNLSVLNIKADNSSDNTGFNPNKDEQEIVKMDSILIMEKKDSKQEEDVEEEFQPSFSNDVQSVCGKSVISSNILTHINNPKSISAIRTDNMSTYSRSEYSVNINDLDLRASQQSMIKPFSQLIRSTDMSEFEVINDNDRFQKFIETPKSTSGKQNNPAFKSLMDNIYKKENAIKHVYEKLGRVKKTLTQFEEENRKVSREIEKEEAEGERLRHILNFLLSQRE